MPDFETCLTEVCESVLLKVLGANGKASTTWWLVKSGVTLSDCSRRPEEFDEALVELFQPIGALVIEARILTGFYGRLGARYVRGDSLSFADEVEKARSLYAQARRL
jgi:hypothetical protein